jgi:hypothetical protein
MNSFYVYGGRVRDRAKILAKSPIFGRLPYSVFALPEELDT